MGVRGGRTYLGGKPDIQWHSSGARDQFTMRKLSSVVSCDR